MKITLIHGDDSTKARDRFLKIIEALKKRGWNDVNLASSDSISQKVLFPNSLFTENILYIVENFNKIPVSEIKKIKDKESNFSSNILFWQSGSAKETLIKELPRNTNIEKFDLPKNLFIFLDSFFPKNSQNAIKLFHNLIEIESVELVFAMLSRLIRDLYWVQASPNTINYPDWRIKKLKTQSQKFGEGSLIKLISDLCKADINAKTSKLDLTTSVDALILESLK